MKDLAGLISAVASLLWPILGFVALLTFKPELRDLLARLRKGKVFGQEIELAESLSQLNRAASDTASEVGALPVASAIALPAGDEKPEVSALERGVLAEAGRSPKAALLLLASDLEREVRQLLATLGRLGERHHLTFPQAIRLLDKHGGLLQHLAGSLELFWNVRNRLVHGRAASDDDVLRAIDSGLTILRAVQALPHETNVVYHPGTEVFADEKGEDRRIDVHAVILETQSPDGRSVAKRVFPTTRVNYAKGMRVSWEWNGKNGWAESWYRNPDSGVIEYAWTSSSEFVGRNLDDL